MSVSLIGGLGLTLVRVFQQRPATDGQQSGSPHIHAITDEAFTAACATRAENIP
jgi:hypothetical protein